MLVAYGKLPPFITSLLNAGIPSAGTGYELNADRRHSHNGGTCSAVNAFYLQIIIGALILIAVAFDQWQGRREVSVDPRAGTLPQRVRPGRRRPAARGLLRRAAGPGERASRSARRATAARRSAGTVQRGARPRHQRGRLPLPRRRRASTARCSSAATRTRCRSRPSRTIVEVLAAHGVDVVRRRRRRRHADAGDLARDPHPQPRRRRGTADGIVVTPSHNPPDDGGFKYNPPHGGPADTDVTGWIEREANALLERRARRRRSARRAREPCTGATTTCSAYVADLAAVIDLDAIRDAGLQPRRRSARRRQRSPTGRRSPSATGSTSRSSTTRSTRRSGSCRSTGTARSAWTARRRTRWRG